MNTIIRTQRELSYATKHAKDDALKAIDITIERAQTMIRDLEQYRERIADEADPYPKSDIMNWAGNTAQNFVRNVDPHRFADAQAKLAVVEAATAIKDLLPTE